MKITGVKIHHYQWERGPYHWRDGIMPSSATASGAFLRILTDEGIEGLSPGGGGANIEEIKYRLIGADPLDRERIWQDFWRNLRSSRLGFAIGPVDENKIIGFLRNILISDPAKYRMAVFDLWAVDDLDIRS